MSSAPTGVKRGGRSLRSVTILLATSLICASCHNGEAVRLSNSRQLLQLRGVNSTDAPVQQQSRTEHSTSPQSQHHISRHTHRRSHSEVPALESNQTLTKLPQKSNKNLTVSDIAVSPSPQQLPARSIGYIVDEVDSAPASESENPIENRAKDILIEELPSPDPKSDEVSKEKKESEEKKAYAAVVPKDRPQRSGILDIVLTHYDPKRMDVMVKFWGNFLRLEKVQALKPYVYIYCQNEKLEHLEQIQPLLAWGGEITLLPNVGRESHAYLQHITGHYNSLANYTIFAQDLASEDLPLRFEKLFEPKTGFLPLAMVGHVYCQDQWLPPGAIPQVYAMFANQLCPPEGYTSSFEGQFLVSRSRIRAHGWWTYRHLMDLVAAPLDHWIHKIHDNQYYKDKSNPMFGHVLERTWSVAFNCYEAWREANCYACVGNNMENCGPDACQCFDK